MKKIMMLLLLSTWFASSAAVEVIVNEQVVFTEPPTKEVIQNIFMLRQQTWSDGKQVHVYVLPKNSIITQAFAYNILCTTSELYFNLLSVQPLACPECLVLMLDELAMLTHVGLDTQGIGYLYNLDYVKHFKHIRVLNLR